jgi:ribonuclease T2
MTLLKWMSTAVVMSAVLQSGSPFAAPTADQDFSYYVTVLSWSPDFCATNPKASKSTQCDVGRKYGFVLHGLWPQHERGYPADCSNEQIPNNIKKKCDIFPTVGLCLHEWKKHGTCSKLGAEGYLDLSAKLKNSLVIPDHFKAPETTIRTNAEQLKAEFVAKNAGFSKDAIAPYCSGSGRFLKEVFFCYDKAGKPRACSAEVLNRSAKSCAQKDGFVVRNVK